MKSKGKKQNAKVRTILLYAVLAASYFLNGLLPATVFAQQTLTSPSENVNPNSPGFQLSVCDGPALPLDVLTKEQAKLDKSGNPHKYVPCDFNGLMLQAQHLIDAAIVLGVLAAIIGFSYAGYLYISVSWTGKEDSISRAKDIFKKVGIGFILILSAWFIVYQILAWLTGTSGFAFLLGGP